MPNVTLHFNPSLDELRNKFGDIRIDNFLRDQVQKIAFRVEGEAKKITPVDTGRLRASITTRLGNGGFQALVQPNTTYMFFVHEGTRYMRARPFMTWGANSATMGLDADIARDLEKVIQEAIK